MPSFPIDKLTMSSDGGGCLPCFNQCGELLRMDVGRSETLVHALRQITEDGYPLEQTLKLCTENPAKLFRFHGRGTIEVGGYADLVLFDSILMSKRHSVKVAGWSRMPSQSFRASSNHPSMSNPSLIGERPPVTFA